MSRFNPPDNRPIGLNNINHLVQDHLGNSGYNVVNAVYQNLEWLHSLVRSLEDLKAVNTHMVYTKEIIGYLDNIKTIATNMSAIVTLNKDMDFIANIAPRIAEFKADVVQLKSEIKYHNTETSKTKAEIANEIKKFKELYLAFETNLHKQLYTVRVNFEKNCQSILDKIEHKHKELSKLQEDILKKLPVFEAANKNYNKTVGLLAHLKASDAVTMAMSFQSEDLNKAALQAIKDSEACGNCEELNRSRLNYTGDSTVTTTSCNCKG